MRNNNIISEKVKKLIEKNPIILDTETTGLGRKAEIIEIAAVDIEGNVLVDTYVEPVGFITLESTKIHGIVSKDLEGAPTFDIVWKGSLENLFKQRIICTYNIEFDIKMIKQSLKLYGMHLMSNIRTECIMKMFAEYVGEWDSRNNHYKWFSLENAAKRLGITVPEGTHRALADSELARLILIKMAGLYFD